MTTSLQNSTWTKADRTVFGLIAREGRGNVTDEDIIVRIQTAEPALIREEIVRSIGEVENRLTMLRDYFIEFMDSKSSQEIATDIQHYTGLHKDDAALVTDAFVSIVNEAVSGYAEGIQKGVQTAVESSMKNALAEFRAESTTPYTSSITTAIRFGALFVGALLILGGLAGLDEGEPGDSAVAILIGLAGISLFWVMRPKTAEVLREV